MKHIYKYNMQFSLQVSELRAKVLSTKDANLSIKKQLDEMENQLRQAEQELLRTRDERDTA